MRFTLLRLPLDSNRLVRDHLGGAARALRALCGRQLLSDAAIAYHIDTIDAIGPARWKEMVDAARWDGMAEFWHVCHVAMMLNVRLVVVRAPTRDG